MACVTSSGQVAEMVKCSRPSQTESIFVATDAFAGKVYVEDLSAKRNVTARSYPCVLDLTFLFFCVFLLLSFIPGFQIRI